MESVQYSVNKSKILFGFAGPRWEQRIVAELDSALNNWVDSVPDHRLCPSISVHLLILTQTYTCSPLGPKPRRLDLLQSIRVSARSVLSHANHGSPVVYTLPEEAGAAELPVRGDMRKRGQVVQSCG
jgi:hypothetical protein